MATTPWLISFSSDSTKFIQGTSSSLFLEFRAILALWAMKRLLLVSVLEAFAPPTYFSTSLYPSLLCTFSPVFSFSILSFVPVLPVFVPHFPSQKPVKHARSRSLLQRASFPFHLPFPPVLPCIVDLTSSALCFSPPFLLEFF